jgi:outer membrane protein, multidrug efflux system
MNAPIPFPDPDLNPNLNLLEKKIRITIGSWSWNRSAWHIFTSWPGMILALLLAGCAVGPNYKQPSANAPQNFRGDTTGQTNSLGDLPWWQLFQDPALQTLIHAALTNNYDLRVAAARVEESRALLAQSRSQFYPQVNYQAASGAGRNEQNGSPFDSGSPAGKGSDAAGSVSWEIDLWGRIRRLNESARANFFATEEVRTNVVISLIASVAQSYFQLLALDEELAIARETTNSFGESLKIFADRLHGGVSSKLETSAAAAALASAAATIPELRRQIILQENQIRVLLGQNPGPVARPPGALQTESLPEVPAGLPSALLERRPDIRQAVQLMRSANAKIGVSQANFYPQFSLTGLLGVASTGVTPFTGGPEAAWYAAGNLAGPIFEGGLLKAQLRQARAAWDESRFEYQSTVLNAFQEVSDALASRQELASERLEQERAVADYKEAVQVANQRYLGGQANYYELLQEQQLLFPAQDALTQTLLNQLLASVQLYKALGGGWNVNSRP